MSIHSESSDVSEEAAPPLWRNRNFVRFFFGQFVTNAGDSLYSVAILWLVFELSGSTTVTGIASSLLLLPYLLQIIAGPIVDRFRIKRLMVGTQIVQGAVVLVVPVAAYTGNLTVWLLIATIPTLSVMTMLFAPVQSTLVPRIVEDDQLARSNSVLATVTLGLDMIFDAVGGLFIAVFGATALFVLDSVTFAIAGVLFFGMAIPTVNGGTDHPEQSVLRGYGADLRDGIGILRGTVFVDMVVISAVRNFAVGVTLAILPAFGGQLGGPAFYGLLLGALGVGRLLGSLAASSLGGVPYGRFKTVTFLASALLWAGAVYAPSPVLTVVLFGMAWVAPGADAVLISTMNQRVFPTDLLGRISSIKGTASTATLPLGSLVGGVVATQFGTVTTMGLAALGVGFAGTYFALHPVLRGLPSTNRIGPSVFDVDVEGAPASESPSE